MGQMTTSKLEQTYRRAANTLYRNLIRRDLTSMAAVERKKKKAAEVKREKERSSKAKRLHPKSQMEGSLPPWAMKAILKHVGNKKRKSQKNERKQIIDEILGTANDW